MVLSCAEDHFSPPLFLVSLLPVRRISSFVTACSTYFGIGATFPTSSFVSVQAMDKGIATILSSGILIIAEVDR